MHPALGLTRPDLPGECLHWLSCQPEHWGPVTTQGFPILASTGLAQDQFQTQILIQQSGILKAAFPEGPSWSKVCTCRGGPGDSDELALSLS